MFAALAVFGVVRRTLVSDRLRPRFGPAVARAGRSRRARVGRPPADDRCRHLRHAADRGADGPVLPPDAVLRDPRGGTGHRAGAATLVVGRRRRRVRAGHGQQADHGDGALRRLLVGLDVRTPDRPGFDAGSAWASPRCPAGPSWLRWRLYAGLAATWVILVAGLALERWPHSIGIDREGWTPWTYLLTQAGVIVHYLRLSFVPVPSSSTTTAGRWRGPSWTSRRRRRSSLVLLGATIVAIIRRAPWGFAAAWFFALLAPSSSILPLATEIAAERRMYTALVAVVALAVIGAYVLGQFLLERLVPDRRRWRTARAVAFVALAGVAGGLAMLTLERNRDYWSEERIWRDTVDKRPDNPQGAAELRRRPRRRAALSGGGGAAARGLRLKEPVAKAHLNLGSILCSAAAVRRRRPAPGARRRDRSRTVDRAGESRRGLRRARTPRAGGQALRPGRRGGARQAVSPESAWMAAGHVAGRRRARRRQGGRSGRTRGPPDVAAGPEVAGHAGGRLRRGWPLRRSRSGRARSAGHWQPGAERVDRALADRLSLYTSGRKFRESR